MAYITKEQVKNMRAQIKKEFPTKDGWKFSITTEHYSGIRVAIMQSPFKIVEKGYSQLNNMHWGVNDIVSEEALEALKMINAICNENNFDNSDLMTDYHHVGWYVWIHIGKWDQDTVVLDQKVAA